jgi:hypothetical protein
VRTKATFWLDVNLNDKTSGGLHALCLAETLSRDFEISVRSFAKESPSLNYPHENFKTLRAYVPNKLRRIYSLIFLSEIFRFFTTLTIVARTSNQDRKHVVFLQSQMTLYLIFILQIIRVDLIVVIWDPFEWWLDGVGVGGPVKKMLLRLNRNILAHSKFILTPSERMTIKLKEEGIDASITEFYYFSSSTPISRNKRGTIKKIGFVGQLYAIDSLLSFIRSLSKINEKIEFHVFGSKADCLTVFPQVIFHPWCDQELLLGKLVEMDFLYCPYSFDPDLSNVMALSFPSKFITYASTGIPIIIHSPPYSSLNIYLNSRGYDLIIKSNDEREVLDGIKQLLGIDEKDYSKYSSIIKSLYFSTFTKEVQGEKILKWLNSKGHW